MKKELITLVFAFVVVAAVSAQSPLRSKEFNLDKGLAVQGYDPVAYFTEGRAVKGTRDFSATVDGVVYYFANPGDKDTFLKDWKKYEPQYGGWCAYAMGATGGKVEIDPGTFKIIDGKLYLFYNKFFNNTLKSWNKDQSNLKQKADANWQKFNH